MSFAIKYRSPLANIYRGEEANNELASRILSLADLPDGWHYGVGRGATRSAVMNALAVSAKLRRHGATDIEVFPEIEGGILMAGYCGDECIEVLCCVNGNFDVVYEVSDEVVSEYLGLNWDEFDMYYSV